MKIKFFRLLLLLLLLPFLSGCWYAAAVGAGAAVGYIAAKEGYKAQSPITYESPNRQQDQDKEQN